MGKRRGVGEGSIYRDCRSKGAGHGRDDHRGCRSYWTGVAEVRGGVWCERSGRFVRQRRNVVRRNFEDCVEALRQLQRQVDAGVVPDKKMPVGRWLDRYLAFNSANLTEGGIKQAKVKCNWVKRFLGNVRLHQLRRHRVQSMLTALATRARARRPCSRRSASSVRRATGPRRTT